MAYDNRDSGCGAVAAILLALILGLGVMVLVGLFFFLSASRDEAVMASKVAIVAEQQVRASEVVPAQERDSLDAEANPDAVVTITLDAEGNILVDDAQVDLEGLRSQLTNARSSQYLVTVDDHCRFEHVSTVLSLIDEVGVERPEFDVSVER